MVSGAGREPDAEVNDDRSLIKNDDLQKIDKLSKFFLKPSNCARRARRGRIGPSPPATQSRRSADRREGHSYTSHGQVARMVERKSVIQSSFATPSSRLYQPDPSPSYRPRVDGAKFRGLDTGRFSQLWVNLPHGAKTASCPFLHCRLNRSTQHRR